MSPLSLSSDHLRITPLQDALRYGGPVGAFLGYSIVGTVVYCLCVSVGEMIAFLCVYLSSVTEYWL